VPGTTYNTEVKGGERFRYKPKPPPRERGRAPFVTQFRSFRNTDPPSLVEIWNESVASRSTYLLRSATLLEHCLFAKPYFDPAGLILADDGDKTIGFVHAGFGPNAAENDISFETGVICALAVRQSHRRRKIGSQLLSQAEEYLRAHGANRLVAGAVRPLNPFYFGLYGGADSPGFLASDPAAAPFFEHHGFRAWNTLLVLDRKLEAYQMAIDPRFVGLRRRFDVQLVPQAEIGSWWKECVLGNFEAVEFRLQDKLSGIPAARTLVWEMSAGRTPGNAAAGILDIQVRPDLRRQGLAKFLLNQVLRYIQEQFFRMAQAHVPESNQAAIALFQSLGFEQSDFGRSYERSLAGASPEAESGAGKPA
jgi:ribosomal protein S18 acetylase RimI-like enzyme